MHLARWLRRRVRILFRRDEVESDLSDEIRLHLDMEAQELVRHGRSPDEARREARLLLGGVEHTKEAVRDSRPLHWLNGVGLDVRLGLRMLRKSWGLTLVGGFAMAVAMTLGAAVFNFIDVLQGTSVPLEEGDRVVVVQSFDPETREQRNSSVEDLERWREELSSLEDVGGFRNIERDVTTDAGPLAPVTVAEMSPAGFELARIAPLMGRFLLTEDEPANAPPVVVIGYESWRSAFAADPDIVGQQVQLDDVFHTIVGVIPADFGFPFDHQYWASLKANPLDHVTVVARLAPGATLESARAEVGTMTQIESRAGPPIQAVVAPYVRGIVGDISNRIAALLPLVLPLLLIPPCTNIAILIYARTIERQGEFAARTALGASRGRIITQIVVEVLLLTSAAAGAALVLAPSVAEALSSILPIYGQPFWMKFTLSYGTILYTATLAAVAALIAGAIPALRATGRWQLAGLHALHRVSAPRLGRTWTAIVVAQVALSVAVVPTSLEFAWAKLRPAILGPGFEVNEFLTARLEMDGRMDGREVPAAAAARFSALRAEVVRQLEVEPGITAVTMSKFKPFEEWDQRVAVELPGPVQDSHSVAFNQVDAAFFDVFGVQRLAGRGFELGDTDPQGDAIVNRSFVNLVLAGENPVGRTVRVIGLNGPETRYEIVGLVDDQFALSDKPTMYRPLMPVADGPASDGGLSVHLAIHTGSTIPPDLSIRLREITTALDPALRVEDVQPLDEIYWNLSVPSYILGLMPVAVALGLLVFATVGIYTLTSFAVVQRSREIGIRSALGASPLRLVAGIFRRVLAPVFAGVALGGVTAILLDFYLSPVLFNYPEGGRLPWILPAAEALVLLVGVVALSGPALRALRVDTVEALQEG